MKILLVHNKYRHPGGEDYVFVTEKDLLQRHGHQVDCLVFDNAAVCTLWDKVCAGLSIFYNFKSANTLKRKLSDFKPDVIHIHNIFHLASPSVLFIASRFKIPVVMTLHNYRLICPSATLYYKGIPYEKSIHSFFPLDAVRRGVYRNSWLQTLAVAGVTVLHSILGTWRNKVSLHIALTEFARKKFICAAHSIPEEKILVKPNSVADYGKGDRIRKEYFLFVGRLAEEKGIVTLLRATRIYPFKLVIIGDGPLKASVEELAHGNSNVEYLGFRDKPTIVHHMKLCRALIFPSTWYEGMPITILEAFSMGTVVIASKLGAMNEIIEDGVNGLHFEPGKEKQLVRRITDVIENRVDLHKLSTGARSSYERHYTPERNYSLLLSAYQRAIPRRKHLHGQGYGTLTRLKVQTAEP